MARLYAGTSGYAYPAWKPGFYPADLPASRFLRALREPADLCRDQLHVPPHAVVADAGVVGAGHAAGVHVRAEGAPADHAHAPARRGRAGAARVLPGHARPAARGGEAGPCAGAVAAQPPRRPGPAGAVPRPAARGRALRVRVPRRVVVHGGGLRPAARARRVALCGRCRGPGRARRGDGGLQPTTASAGPGTTTSRCSGCAAVRTCCWARGATSSSCSSTRTTPAARTTQSACSPPDGRRRRPAAAAGPASTRSFPGMACATVGA